MVTQHRRILPTWREALRRLRNLRTVWPAPAPPSPFIKYRDKPLEYARDVLGVDLWSKQQEGLEALLQPPYRVMMKSAHSVGKSFLAAVACCWWYDTRPRSVCITTAPTAESVRDIIWKEIRVLRLKAKYPYGPLGGFHGTEQPLLKDGPDHYAKGRTAESGEAFQGRHDLEMLFIFDEAVGIPRVFWETTNTMCKPGNGHAWLAILNPTDTTTQAYQEESLMLGDSPKWRTIQMAALEHPNIAAQLENRQPPYPSAVTLEQFWDAILEGCSVVDDEKRPTDFEFPPKSGRWWRPGPVFQARWLGVWPENSEGVWSDALWRAITSNAQPLPGLGTMAQLGCDVARKGQDFTAFHMRWGNCSIHHSRYNGWDLMRTVGECIRLVREFAERYNTKLVRPGWMPPMDPKTIPMAVDDDGLGGGVTDRLRELGYRVYPIGAGTEAARPDLYPKKRSELWFDTVEQARMGKVDLSRLSPDHKTRLKQQAMAPTWKIDSAGRRVVESKDDTKKKIGCSPDDMDAVNLAYYPVGMFGGEVDWKAMSLGR